MFNDTQSLHEATAKAKALGAVSIGACYYPPPRSYALQDRGTVFAYYYFNDDGGEVGYWLVSMRSWTEHAKPREWSEAALRELTFQKLGE